MEQQEKNPITISATVNASLDKVWDCWNEPEHITGWSFASDDWHTPHAQNDLRTGGSFSSRMEAKDGSMGFDFAGVYDEVNPKSYIAYTMGDGRKVSITFRDSGSATEITETFEPEQVNSRDMQQAGWQAILDNFKRYTEQR